MGMKHKVQKVQVTFRKETKFYFHSCFFALPDSSKRGSGGKPKPQKALNVFGFNLMSVSSQQIGPVPSLGMFESFEVAG